MVDEGHYLGNLFMSDEDDEFAVSAPANGDVDETTPWNTSLLVSRVRRGRGISLQSWPCPRADAMNARRLTANSVLMDEGVVCVGTCWM